MEFIKERQNNLIKKLSVNLGFALIKSIILIVLFIFPWYITGPETGRLLAVDSGASLSQLLKIYFNGTSSLSATMLSVSAAVLITVCMVVASIFWIVSGILNNADKGKPFSILAFVFTLMFFGSIFASQIFWPTIMPWLCYGSDFPSAVTSFQLQSNPSFNITHWFGILFMFVLILEFIVNRRVNFDNKNK